MGQYLKNKRSSAVVNNAPKLPTSSQIDYGEIAINFAKGYETISVKNNNDEIVTFSSDSVLDKKYISSGAVVTELGDIKDKIETLSGSSVFVVTGRFHSRYQTCSIDNSISEIRDAIDNGQTVILIFYYIDSDSITVTGINEMLIADSDFSMLLDLDDGQGEQSYNGILFSSVYYDSNFNAASVFAYETQYGDTSAKLLSDTLYISNFFTDAEYDSITKRINFKNGNTIKDYIDATDFIKDGMVSGVTVSGGNLVISFNTDAGREDISLALTQIFNPNNYYDKDSADAKFLSAYTETDPVFTASPAYNITTQDLTDWDGKQDAISDLSNIRNNAASGASAYTAVTSHIANTGLHLPAVTSENNGKILQVVNGAWALVTPVTIYTGNGEPSSVLGNNGDLYLQTS